MQKEDLVLEEVAYPKDITLEFLAELLERAFIPYEIKGDQTIHINEMLGCFVTPSPDGRLVQLMLGMEGNPDVPREEKLSVINSINNNKRMVRAAVEDDGDIMFDYSINVDGGVCKACLVRTIRAFLTLMSMTLTSPELLEIIA